MPGVKMKSTLRDRGYIAEAKPALGKVDKWGFDQLEFKVKDGFKQLIKKFGLRLAVKEKHPGRPQYHWTGKDGVLIVTAYNPNTGEGPYPDDDELESHKNFAGYVGIEGKPETVKEVVQLLRKTSWNQGESPGDREFI